MNSPALTPLANPVRWFVIAVALAFAFPVTVLAHGDFHLRIGTMMEHISRETNNAHLYLQRGELYRLHQDWQAAEADYDRAAQLDPKLGAVDFCRGKMLADSGQLPQAKVMFDRYLAGNPQDGQALVARARVFAKLGQNKTAVTDFTKAISLLAEPQPEFFLERSQALAADGKVEEALRGLDEGVKRLGPIVTLQLAAIDLNVERKHYDAALARVETILAQAARKESWLAKRGDIELLMGHRADARKSYEAARAAWNALPLRFQKSHSMLQLRVHLNTALAGLTNALTVTTNNATVTSTNLTHQ